MGRIVGDWRVWLAVVPLSLAVGLLQLFAPSVPAVPAPETLPAAIRGSAFLPGLLTFRAITLVHLLACAGALWFAVDLLKRTPGSSAYGRAAALMTGATLLALIGSVPLGLRAVGVSHDAVATFFTNTGIGGSFGRPTLGQVTPLEFAMLIPTAAGIAAVAAVAAAAWAQLPLFRRLVGPTDRREKEAKRRAEALRAATPQDRDRHKQVAAAFARAQAARINQVNDRMKRCLAVLAIVLVTSTVAASLFFHLPSAVASAVKPAEPAFSFVRFGDELSIFWGCVYTATLAVAVGLPLYLLQERVRRLLEPPFPSEEADARRKQLAGAAPLGGLADQVKFVGTLLAPLAAGPVVNLVQAFAKG
jgi:hypothetical protein